jgi:hypothetical protein
MLWDLLNQRVHLPVGILASYKVAFGRLYSGLWSKKFSGWYIPPMIESCDNEVGFNPVGTPVPTMTKFELGRSATQPVQFSVLSYVVVILLYFYNVYKIICLYHSKVHVSRR